MEFNRLTDTRDTYFTEAFSLYEKSFPKSEKRLLPDQEEAMKDSAFHCDVILDDNQFAGILFYWKISGFCYIEHFAIATSLRGKNIGSRSLKQFCEIQGRIILEIDPPVDDISTRRERFYNRLGFVVNPYEHTYHAYQNHCMPQKLVLMTYPEQIGEKEYNLFNEYLQNHIMKYSEPNRENN